MTNDEKRLEIARAVRACLNTEWMHQGRRPGLGLDCIGLALIAARAVGEVTPEQEAEIPNYGVIPHKNSFLRFMQRNLSLITWPEVLVGDLALICWRSYPMHVGIMVDRDARGSLQAPFDMIHADAASCGVREMIFDPKGVVVHGYYRFRGLA